MAATSPCPSTVAHRGRIARQHPQRRAPPRLRTRDLRTRRFEGEVLPLLRLKDDLTVIARILDERGESDEDSPAGSVHVWGTLPRSDHSALASEGVVFS